MTLASHVDVSRCAKYTTYPIIISERIRGTIQAHHTTKCQSYRAYELGVPSCQLKGLTFTSTSCDVLTLDVLGYGLASETASVLAPRYDDLTNVPFW